VGPQRYNPNNPNHKKTDNLKGGNSIGKALRGDLVSMTNNPAPGKYDINGDFEKAQSKPKFHMGIKT